MNLPNFEYKGYKYQPHKEIEADGDNIKIFHEVSTPEGSVINHLDWSPYSVLSFEEFKMFVEVGFPDRFWIRPYGGPLDLSELETLLKLKLFGTVLE